MQRVLEENNLMLVWWIVTSLSRSDSLRTLRLRNYACANVCMMEAYWNLQSDRRLSGMTEEPLEFKTDDTKGFKALQTPE